MSEPIRVLLVSDQPVYRAGLRTLLARAPSLAMIDAVDSQAAAARIGTRHPDLVLWHEPSLRGGGSITAAMRGGGTPLVWVIVSGEDQNPRALRDVWQAGAAGWLHQDITPEALVAAVCAAANGASLWTVEQLARIREWEVAVLEKWRGLTAREREVLSLLADACGNAEIASRLRISPKTVERHVSSILGKLSVCSRVAAALWLYDARSRGDLCAPEGNPSGKDAGFPR